MNLPIDIVNKILSFLNNDNILGTIKYIDDFGILVNEQNPLMHQNIKYSHPLHYIMICQGYQDKRSYLGFSIGASDISCIGDGTFYVPHYGDIYYGGYFILDNKENQSSYYTIKLWIGPIIIEETIIQENGIIRGLHTMFPIPVISMAYNSAAYTLYNDKNEKIKDVTLYMKMVFLTGQLRKTLVLNTIKSTCGFMTIRGFVGPCKINDINKKIQIFPSLYIDNTEDSEKYTPSWLQGKTNWDFIEEISNQITALN